MSAGCVADGTVYRLSYDLMCLFIMFKTEDLSFFCFADHLLNVKPIWEYFLTNSNLRPVLGSQRNYLDPQNTLNKPTAALESKKSPCMILDRKNEAMMGMREALTPFLMKLWTPIVGHCIRNAFFQSTRVAGTATHSPLVLLSVADRILSSILMRC